MSRAQRNVGKAGAAIAVVAVVVLVAYAAVTDAKPSRPADLAEPRPDPVLVQSTVRLTAVAPDVGETTVSVRNGISSPDGSRIFRSGFTSDGETRLRVFDPVSGERIWSTHITSGYVPRAAAHDGSAVLVGYGSTVDANGYPFPQTQTPFTVVRLDGTAPQRIELDGNFAPEAFSYDGDSVFLVEYVPAQAPTGYRVRQLDLTTERVHPVDSPDITPQDTMGGTARSQVLSPDGTRLYTLYSIAAGQDGGHHGVEPTNRSFVHVLDLKEKWAHCIDLPQPFGTDPMAAAALAVSPDDDELFVTDTATGAVARIDTVNLSPDDVFEPDLAVTPTAAAVNADGTLFVGGGGRLQMVDTASGEVTGGWTTGGYVESLEVGTNGDLYVATPGRVTVVTPTGDRRVVELPNDDAVILGRGGYGLLGNRQVFECAC